MIPSVPRATIVRAGLWTAGAAALALVVGSACGLAAASRAGAGERLERARDLTLARKPDAAMRELRRALAEFGEPDRSALRLRTLHRAAQVADFHMEPSRPTEAIGYYRRMAQDYPGTPEAFDAGARIAEILVRGGDAVHAEQQLAETAAAFPALAGAGRLLLRAARLATDARRWEDARAHARAVLERAGDGDEHPEALAILAGTYHLEGRHAEAARAYEQVAGRFPGTEGAARALFEAGNCLAEQGDFGHAMARYLESLPEHPDPLAVQRSLERVRRRFTALRATEPGSKALAFGAGPAVRAAE